MTVDPNKICQLENEEEMGSDNESDNDYADSDVD